MSYRFGTFMRHFTVSFGMTEQIQLFTGLLFLCEKREENTDLSLHVNVATS